MVQHSFRSFLQLTTSTMAIAIVLCLDSPRAYAGRIPGQAGIPMGVETSCSLDIPESTIESCNNAISLLRRHLNIENNLQHKSASRTTDAQLNRDRLITEHTLSEAYHTLRTLQNHSAPPPEKMQRSEYLWSPRLRPPAPQQISNNIWYGVVALGVPGTSNAFTNVFSVTGTLVVQSIASGNPAGCPNNENLYIGSNWIGIGGAEGLSAAIKKYDTDTSVIQAGIDDIYDCTNNSMRYRLWYQDTHINMTEQVQSATTYPVSAGDTLTITVSAGPTSTYTIVSSNPLWPNNGTLTLNSTDSTIPVWSAEAITERVCSDGCLTSNADNAMPRPTSNSYSFTGVTYSYNYAFDNGHPKTNQPLNKATPEICMNKSDLNSSCVVPKVVGLIDNSCESGTVSLIGNEASNDLYTNTGDPTIFQLSNLTYLCTMPQNPV